MCDSKNDSPNRHKSTPPTNKKVCNPFDRALIERLHNPICSPSMCKMYKEKSSGSFRWDIDQASTLVPADIVACSSQFEPSPDPALERIAEEANEKFFSQELVIPSPLESSKKVKPLQTSDESLHCPSFMKHAVVMKDAQTVLTLPPELPPEIEKLLQKFCTFTQVIKRYVNCIGNNVKDISVLKEEQNISGEYEITANGSLRRKLFFEEHSDMEHYDSEMTDDESRAEPEPTPSYETHSPVVFSPDLGRDMVAKGMKRTFGTPLKKGALTKPYRNKILDVVDLCEPCFSPIEFRTPKREESVASSSLTSSISPVTKVTSSDEEKNNFTSPESEAMAICLDCITKPKSENKGPCFCKKSRTPDKLILKRSASLKESPPRSRRGSFSLSEKRSLSMSSLHRSRSVQKLDFSMDMSIDGSFHDHSHADLNTNSPLHKNRESPAPGDTWSLIEESSIQQLVKVESQKSLSQEAVSNVDVNILDDTPIKGKCKSIVLSHEISKIRAPAPLSPLHMSLDNSLDNLDNSLSLEDKKIDFNNIDLNFLTDNHNVSQFDYTASNVNKMGIDSSSSSKKLDSGFNENTFFGNASSYYESAIKPSELTIVNASKPNNNKTVLKEISNVPWMRADSGFKEENSADSMQFYAGESSSKTITAFPLGDKENIATDFLVHASSKNETMSMSEIFTDDMTFNCNFSSTPSKNKSRKVHS